MAQIDRHNDYRPIYMVIVYATTVVFCSAFALYHLVIEQGSWAISAFLFLTSLFALLALYDAFHGHRKSAANVATLSVVTLGIALAVAELGLRGIMFCYLTLLIYFFLLPFRRAIIGCVLAICLYTVSASIQLEPTLVFRFSITLLLTASFVAIYAHAVRSQRQQLKAIAITDALTGALNRHSFYLELDKALAQVKRHKAMFSLIVFDVDHFKRLNDEHGHLAGDQILIELTQVIKKRLRKEDIFFRHGGEEFAIILPFTDSRAGKMLAEDLRRCVEQQAFHKNQSVTISLGFASAFPGDTTSSWLSRADELMYSAKRAGRNRIRAELPALSG